MGLNEFRFKEVALLITHYNRSGSFERLLTSFRTQNIHFAEIVVSDDGSKPEHLKKLKDLQQKFTYKLILAQKNKGLGNNINKGQDVVTAPYTLYVQEDFEPKPGFAHRLEEAIDLMKRDEALDIIRFYAYFRYPYLKAYGNGFSEMIFSASPLANNHLKFYVYSDHPHLRRSTFLHKFGRYAEAVNGDLTEYRMTLSFIQNKGKGIFFDRFSDLFDQNNSSDEPSTMRRSRWRDSQNPLILAVRTVYLQFKLLKCTYEVLQKQYSIKFSKGDEISGV